MEDNLKKSFDFALKQTEILLTFSTGILTLIIAFKKEILGTANISNSSEIKTSLILFLVSIFFGILCVGALTNALNKENYNIADPFIAGFSIIQHLLFLGGILFAVLFTLNPLSDNKVQGPSDETSLIAKFSLYFHSGSLIVSDELNNKSTNDIANCLKMNLTRYFKCEISIDGYADAQKIVTPNNRFGNNFELTYGRALNVKNLLSNIISEINLKKPNSISFNLNCYSNEMSKRETMIDRRVDVYIKFQNKLTANK